MQFANFPLATIDWSRIEPTVHPGERGTAYWRTQHVGDIRLRIVEYTPGYRADHWCTKGHIVYCLSGEIDSEIQGGRTFKLTAGMSYQVADNAEPHRSSTAIGAKLFIVD